MKDWKRVQGSWAEKPAEFDTASSAVTVYQRRNFERVKVPDMDGTEHEVWECDLNFPYLGMETLTLRKSRSVGGQA